MWSMHPGRMGAGWFGRPTCRSRARDKMSFSLIVTLGMWQLLVSSALRECVCPARTALPTSVPSPSPTVTPMPSVPPTPVPSAQPSTATPSTMPSASPTFAPSHTQTQPPVFNATPTSYPTPPQPTYGPNDDGGGDDDLVQSVNYIVTWSPGLGGAAFNNDTLVIHNIDTVSLWWSSGHNLYEAEVRVLRTRRWMTLWRRRLCWSPHTPVCAVLQLTHGLCRR